MRILMKSDQTFGNLGDAAMLRVAVTRLQTYCPNACLDVLTPRPDEFLRLFPHVNVLDAGAWSLWADELMFPGRLYRLLPRSWLAGVQQWESSLREHAYTAFRPLARARCRRRHGSSQTLERFFALLAAADAVVVPGGGNLNDAFPYFAHGQLELAGIAKRLGKRVAFFGHFVNRRGTKILAGIAVLFHAAGGADIQVTHLHSQAPVAQFLTQFHEFPEDLRPDTVKKDFDYLEQVAEKLRTDFLPAPKPRPPKEKGHFSSLPGMKWIGKSARTSRKKATPCTMSCIAAQQKCWSAS